MDLKQKQCDCTDKCLGYLTKTCTRKEEQKRLLFNMMKSDEELGLYEEPKQETLEEAIKREYEARKFNSDFPFDPQSFKLGAKWEAKRRYSDEEVKKLIIDFLFEKGIGREVKNVEEWFEQFKKK